MLEPFRNPDDESIRKLLESVRRIAVVGLSPKPNRDSHRVGRFCARNGLVRDALLSREVTP